MNKKRILGYSAILLILLVTLSGCPDSGIEFVYFRNESDQRLVFYVDQKVSESDTLLSDVNVCFRVRKNKSIQWSFDKEYVENGKSICLFVLNQDTIAKYDWEKVREDYMIVRRYDLTMRDIKENNWRITYP